MLSYIRATKKKFCQMKPLNVSLVPLVLEKLARFIAEIVIVECSEVLSSEKITFALSITEEGCP